MRTKKGKLIVLCGASGSGKSTWAHKQWLENNKEVVIVSRDSLREGLFGYDSSNIEKYYSLDNLNSCEKLISEYSHELIQSSLSRGKTVIVDNTHLKLKHINEYKRYRVSTDILLFVTPSDDCVKQSTHCDEAKVREQYTKFIQLINNLKINIDSGIGNSVLFNGTIILQNFNFGTPDIIIKDTTLADAIVVDIDGTLANRGDRGAYEWDRVIEDTLNENVASVVADLEQAGNHIVICSGRDSVCREDTEKWLKENDIIYTSLYMRKQNDNRKDSIVKEEMWREIAKSYNIVALIDDRKQVVDRARELGLTVLDVADNRF